MASLTSFVFSGQDILESTLTPHDSLPPYKTSSNRVVDTPQTTKIETIGSKESPNWIPQSTINWKTHEFQIDTTLRKWNDINTKTECFRSTREWRWSGAAFIVKYNGHRWTATSKSAQNTIIAELLSDEHQTTLSISTSLPSEHLAFLLLVMLYSERKRLKDRSRRCIVHYDLTELHCIRSMLLGWMLIDVVYLASIGPFILSSGREGGKTREAKSLPLTICTCKKMDKKIMYQESVLKNEYQNNVDDRERCVGD